MFLILMVVGLVGLVMMAVPALSRHGHLSAHGHAAHGHLSAHGGHGHAAGHAGHQGAPISQSHGTHGACPPAHAPSGAVAKGVAGTRDAAMDVVAPGGLTRFLPSPRAVFSVLALYGAFGNALVRAVHLPTWGAALAAVVPTLLVERLVVTPLWNMLFRFQGEPCAPLESLLFAEAKAVTLFRNGKGLVSVVRGGRHVQLAARLTEAQAGQRVSVGDRLVVEEVDAPNERLTVSKPE